MSHSGTCAISQLPIEDNEPVRLFFLKHENRRDIQFELTGAVAANDLYNPCVLSTKGKYDNYGGITEKNEKHTNTELILSYFRKQFEGEKINSVRDIIGVLLQEKNKTHAFVLVKESVYQMVLKLDNEEAAFDQRYIRSAKSVHLNQKMLDSFSQSDHDSLREFVKDSIGIKRLGLVDTDLRFDYNAFLEAYGEYYKEGVSASMARRMKDDFHIFALMTHLKKIWTVQSSGPQEGRWPLHKKFYQEVVKLCKPSKNK